jgi:hypothetical protein
MDGPSMADLETIIEAHDHAEKIESDNNTALNRTIDVDIRLFNEKEQQHCLELTLPSVVSLPPPMSLSNMTDHVNPPNRLFNGGSFRICSHR